MKLLELQLRWIFLIVGTYCFNFVTKKSLLVEELLFTSFWKSLIRSILVVFLEIKIVSSIPASVSNYSNS